MASDFLSYLPGILGGSAAVAAACSGLGLALTPTLQKKLLPPPQESLLSDLIPFEILSSDQKTLVCKDGTLVKVIELCGLDYGGKTEEEKTSLLSSRRHWLDTLAKEEIQFQVMTVRRPVLSSTAKEASYDHPVLEELGNRWNQQFTKTFTNRHYLVLSSQKGTKKQGSPGSTQTWQDLTKTMLDYLAPYQPKVVKETETEGGLLSFWSTLINGFEGHFPSKGDNLSRRLVFSSVHFHHDAGLIEWIDGPKRLYGASLSIQEWPDILTDEVFSELYGLSCSLTIHHWLKGYNSFNASKELMGRYRQSKVFFTNAHTQEQYETALEWIQSGQNSFWEVQTSLFLMTETKEQLQSMVEKVRGLLRLKGLKPAQDTQTVELRWFSQFPSFRKILNETYLFSQNIANLLPFPRDQRGLQRCDWGEGPLRLFKTQAGSAYSLQLHVSERANEVAHCLILAPSGQGKTTLFQHLIGGALRHKNLRAYIFDRFNGTRVFTESVGGKVIDLSDPGNLSLNPLQCEDTPTNRAFLQQFLLQLADTHDESSIQSASRAIDAIFELPKDKRILSDIYPSALDAGSVLKKALLKWTGDTPLARFFNGQRDSLDIHENPLVTFEMGTLQENPLAYASMLTYVMHRIRDQVRDNASPHLIFIDESAPMLQNALFREYTKQLFREHRKLRGSITVCFQDPSAITASGMQDTILSQCQTVFLFPNPNAQREDFAVFDLTEDQWDFIKGTGSLKLKHGVLVKRTTSTHSESVILDIDLSGLGPYLKLYESGSEAVNLVKDLKVQFGDAWLPRYLGDAS